MPNSTALKPGLWIWSQIPKNSTVFQKKVQELEKLESEINEKIYQTKSKNEQELEVKDLYDKYEKLIEEFTSRYKKMYFYVFFP